MDNVPLTRWFKPCLNLYLFCVVTQAINSTLFSSKLCEDQTDTLLQPRAIKKRAESINKDNVPIQTNLVDTFGLKELGAAEENGRDHWSALDVRGADGIVETCAKDGSLWQRQTSKGWL